MYVINVFVFSAKKPQTKQTKNPLEMQNWEQCSKYTVYMPENVCFDFLVLRQMLKLLRTLYEFLPH